jgi:F420-dependent oxidoreductase-like protein
VDFRIFTEPQEGATYLDQLRIAQAAEQLGFSAFFRSDHIKRIGPGEPGVGPTDSWVTLGAIARETSTIRLGTLVTSATFRHPSMLAIAAAQVDEMSGGRVELGLGTGWFEGEHAAYGVPFPAMGERFDRFAEQLEIIDGLWRTPAGSSYNFEGDHYTLVDSPALPKPVQSPRPPLILGGSARARSAALAAWYADEYNAFCGVSEAASRFGRIRSALSAVDRAEESMVFSVAQTTCVGRTPEELDRRATAFRQPLSELREGGLAGSPAEVVDKIGRFAEIGATRVYLQIINMADLDHLAVIAEDVVPHFR